VIFFSDRIQSPKYSCLAQDQWPQYSSTHSGIMMFREAKKSRLRSFNVCIEERPRFRNHDFLSTPVLTLVWRDSTVLLVLASLVHKLPQGQGPLRRDESYALMLPGLGCGSPSRLQIRSKFSVTLAWAGTVLYLARKLSIKSSWTRQGSMWLTDLHSQSHMHLSIQTIEYY